MGFGSPPNVVPQVLPPKCAEESSRWVVLVPGCLLAGASLIIISRASCRWMRLLPAGALDKAAAGSGPSFPIIVCYRYSKSFNDCNRSPAAPFNRFSTESILLAAPLKQHVRHTRLQRPAIPCRHRRRGSRSRLTLRITSLIASTGLCNGIAPCRHRCKSQRRRAPTVIYPTLTIPAPEQHVTAAPDSQKNFLVVDAKTDNAAIESTFDKLIERKDIAIILINQHASLPFRIGDHMMIGLTC